jgi:hypothetical protein
MDLQLINSVSDHAVQNFSDLLLGKIGRTIENPLSLIFDPINQSSREVVSNISGNIGIIAGSENKKGLAAINEGLASFVDNTFNNISPPMMILLGIGGLSVLVIALKA